jgi:hypothetical protein
MLIPVSGLINLEDLSEEIKSQYQSRPLTETHVKSLMQVERKDLPPIKVLHSDKGDVVIDGRHRAERARRLDEKQIEAEFVNFSSIDDLIMQGFSSNQKHGMPEKTSRRVDYAMWLVVAKGMSIRDAAKEAMVDKSSVVRRNQKLKEQELELQPVENERLKPLVRFFKALDGLKSYTGSDDDWFNDLREVLQSTSDTIEDIQENLVALVESYSLVVNTK